MGDTPGDTGCGDLEELVAPAFPPLGVLSLEVVEAFCNVNAGVLSFSPLSPVFSPLDFLNDVACAATFFFSSAACAGRCIRCTSSVFFAFKSSAVLDDVCGCLTRTGCEFGRTGASPGCSLAVVPAV